MHLLYCDETNYDERKGDFLIYGGLMLPPGAPEKLSESIEALSKPLPKDYVLKFNPKPQGMTQADFWALKDAVISAAHSAGAKLLAYAVLHDIAKDPDKARLNGINTICLHYHGALNAASDFGIVLIDRFNDRGNQGEQHIKAKFNVGLEGLPYARRYRLNRILGLHYSAIGQSHFPSVTDVLLGSLRFAFNAITRDTPNDQHRAKELIARLRPMFLGGDNGPVPEWGLVFSPKRIAIAPYREHYQSVKAKLGEWGLDTLQEITGERQY